MTTPILALDNTALTLAGNAGPVSILRGITLEVQRGESLGLVGPSGSGKSSLLMVMGGLERATSGSVRALGHDLTAMDEDQLARFRRDNMGVVFQSFHLIPTMTALENVALPLELGGVQDAFGRAEAELNAVGLGARMDHFPSQLSGGEQQRVAIARAIAKRPEVLLCDEPTGALDVQTGIVVLEAIAKINRELGTTTAVITHNAAIAQMADRVISLSNGQIAGTMTNSSKLPASELEW